MANWMPKKDAIKSLQQNRNNRIQEMYKKIKKADKSGTERSLYCRFCGKGFGDKEIAYTEECPRCGRKLRQKDILEKKEE